MVWHVMKLDSVCRNFGYNVKCLNCISGNINMQGRCVCHQAVLGGIEGRSQAGAGLGGHGGTGVCEETCWWEGMESPSGEKLE